MKIYFKKDGLYPSLGHLIFPELLYLSIAIVPFEYLDLAR